MPSSQLDVFVALDHAESVLLGQEVVDVVRHRRVRIQDLEYVSFGRNFWYFYPVLVNFSPFVFGY